MMTGKEMLQKLNEMADRLGVNIPGAWRETLQVVDAADQRIAQADQCVADLNAEAARIELRIAALNARLADEEQRAADRIAALQENVRKAEKLDAEARLKLAKVDRFEEIVGAVKRAVE